MSRQVGREYSGSEAAPPAGGHTLGVKAADTTCDEPFGIIFDFDGVLVDSFVHNARHLIAILAHHGVSITEDDLWDLRGYSLPRLVERFGRANGVTLPYPAIEAALNHRQNEHRASLIERELPDGLEAFLATSRTAGIPLAIGSSNVPPNIHGFLVPAGIDDYFSVIVTQNDTDHHKPEPDVFLIAANRLNVPPERCVVIEDSETGVEAAHRAGMLAVGFTGFLRSSNEPLLPHADLRIASFAELTIERLCSLITER